MPTKDAVNEQELSSLIMIVKTYAQKYDVKITIKGSQAYSTRDEIVVPAIDTSSEFAKRMLLGFIAHEAGHIRYSNFDVFEDIKSEPFKNLVNILEDTRIENLMSKSFIGVYDNFELINRALYKEHLDQFMEVHDICKLGLLWRYILFTCQSRFNHYRDSDVMQGIFYDELSCLINKDGLDKLTNYLETMPAFKSTYAAIRNCEDIYDLIQEPNFFVPDYSRFAERYNLTSRFDFHNIKSLCKRYGQPFSYPTNCPSQMLAQVLPFDVKSILQSPDPVAVLKDGSEGSEASPLIDDDRINEEWFDLFDNSQMPDFATPLPTPLFIQNCTNIESLGPLTDLHYKPQSPEESASFKESKEFSDNSCAGKVYLEDEMQYFKDLAELNKPTKKVRARKTTKN